MRRGYTLIEIIITVAITGILSIGLFKAFEAITIRSEKAKVLTALSLDSQSAINQLSLLLYNRVPISVHQYTPALGWHHLDSDESDFAILEWQGTAYEIYQQGDYSGFIDIFDSNNSTHTLLSPDTNITQALNQIRQKWNDPSLQLSDFGLVFSGTFDEGVVRDDNVMFTINNTSSGENLILNNPQSPMKIYERYYLVDSAYAVALGKDIDKNALCIQDLNIKADLIDTTLFLFSNYRPKNIPAEQHFCASPDNPDISGSASVLSYNVDDFRASTVDGIIRLKINMRKNISGNQNPIRISKQKVVF